MLILHVVIRLSMLDGRRETRSTRFEAIRRKTRRFEKASDGFTLVVHSNYEDKYSEKERRDAIPTNRDG